MGLGEVTMARGMACLGHTGVWLGKKGGGPRCRLWGRHLEEDREQGGGAGLPGVAAVHR